LKKTQKVWTNGRYDVQCTI